MGGCKRDGVEASAKGGVYHDCKASPTNIRSGWSDEKQKWCCKNQGVACAAVNPTARTGGHIVHVEKAGSPAKFDCMMDIADFKTKWHEDKKVWCCEKKNIGCSVKYHKGHRVWFSRRFELQSISQPQKLQSISSIVQVVAGAAAACMLAFGAVLVFRRRSALYSWRHPSYVNFLGGGSDLEVSSSISA